MVGLPENWEWDHDGKRWFYRYKPTGLIQYTFPKPGDEFPDFVEDDAPPLDLAPEERLVSQQQTRRRSTLGEDSSKPKRKEGKSSFILEEEDDDPGAYWERPDALMYMGPGAYNDISPLEDDIRQEDAKPDPPAPTQASQKAADVKPVTEQLDRIQISPLASAQTTPLVVNSQPISSPPENSVPIAEVSHTVIVAEVPAEPVAPAVPVVPAAPAVSTAPAPAPATVVAAPPAPAVNVFPDVPMLDSREIPHNPVGFVAELASELTAQCHDEIHPAPVELPGNEMMMEANAQQHPAIAYANAFPLAPAELHSEALLPSQVQKRHSVEQKALAMRPPELDGQLRQQPVIEAREPVQEIPPGARPAHLRQNSMPQPGQGHPQASNPGIDPAQGKFKPYNPGLRPVAENNTGGNQYAPSSTTGFSISSPPISSFGGGNKRHSLAGPPPSHLKGSEVRPGLQSIRTWQQLPPTEEREEAISRTHGSQPNNGQVAVDSGLAHIPSVLKPARGRPNLSQSPPRSQSPPSPPQADTSQKYQAYQPIASIDQSLQQDIESTLNELSKTGYDYDTDKSAPWRRGRQHRLSSLRRFSARQCRHSTTFKDISQQIATACYSE
ncbi:hypothetical protein QBC42DRAFT_331774 [Cladorrhinum samala]|uniref:WW domain-containing protein n=1 Tax=Cladorrhinum samala TaxID=585594 RepID=A0AAV9HJ60_9PEZI|nr:hypothetical protein QBC42DRAFT_331774 [Cladorrhinum samala]